MQSDFVDGPEEWVTVGHCYVDVRPLRGREYFDASSVESTITHKIETEFRSDVTSEMRLKVGESRFFNIESVINVNEGNRSLELMCGENR